MKLMASLGAGCRINEACS